MSLRVENHFPGICNFKKVKDSFLIVCNWYCVITHYLVIYSFPPLLSYKSYLFPSQCQL